MSNSRTRSAQPRSSSSRSRLKGSSRRSERLASTGWKRWSCRKPVRAPKMRDRVRVLVVEDDADDFALTRELLATANDIQFEVDRAETYDAALEAMARN